MDYYQILGINREASQDEIKKAYRSLAMRHHPDRGGDANKFKEIEEAYRTLGDEQKRAEYDNPQPQFHFHSGPFGGGFEDIFSQFGFGPNFGPGFRSHRIQKNKNLNIKVEVTLKEVINGKEVIGSIQLPSGREQTVHLHIPPGVSNGDNIRFSGLGDDSIQGIPRGDIIVQIFEIPDHNFIRNGSNIIMIHTLSVFDAILGKKLRVMTPEDKELEISIPSGIQPNQIIKCSGHGLPRGNSRSRGDLHIQFNVEIPKDIKEEDIEIVKKLQKKYES